MTIPRNAVLRVFPEEKRRGPGAFSDWFSTADTKGAYFTLHAENPENESSASVELAIQLRDPVTGGAFALTGFGAFDLRYAHKVIYIYPGAKDDPSFAVALDMVMPTNWRVVAVHNDANVELSYSLGAQMLL
jgi:hypothetical protein